MATAAALRVGVHNLDARIVRRSVGHSVTAAAAYNARCRIVDDRTGEIHDYTRHSNRPIGEYFFAPQNGPEWAQTRDSYWNAVERRENRQDSQLARSFIITLPHDMSPEHVRLALVDFVRENFSRKGYGADLVIHPAHDHGDDRNLHAHLLVSLRTVNKDGTWSKKKDPAEPDVTQLLRWKEQCAHHLNNKLDRFGYDFRVDHRSLEERGIDQEPQIKLGKDAAALERKGIRTDAGDENREIAARNAVRRAQLMEPTPAPVESAIDRQRREEREQLEADAKERESYGIRNAGIPSYIREIMAALWKLGQTMGQALSRIVLGADRDSLIRQIRFERQEAQRQAAEAERQRAIGRVQIRTEIPLADPRLQIEPTVARSSPSSPATEAPQQPQAKPHERLIDTMRRKLTEVARRPADELRDLLPRPDEDDNPATDRKGPKFPSR